MSSPTPKKKDNKERAHAAAGKSAKKGKVPKAIDKVTKASGRTPKKRGPKKNRATTQRGVTVRVELYHSHFNDAFRNPNPKKRYHSHAQLAKKFGYSKAMVRRDIQMLQNDHQLPLEFIEQYGGWGYTEEVLKAPTVRMTRSDLVLICTAWSALEGVRGTPLADRAAETFEKLIQTLGPDLGEDLRKVRERISFRGTNHYAAVDAAVFETVSDTLLDGEELEFDYRKLDRGGSASNGTNGKKTEQERRHVQPRHLLNHDGAWYLYSDEPDSSKSHEPSAKLGERGAMGTLREAEVRGAEGTTKSQDSRADSSRPVASKRRKFALSRMKGVRSTGKRFEPESEFDIDEEMRPGIGVQNTGRKERVRLRFTGVAAQLIAEKHWHGTQQMRQHADGSVELTLSVVRSPELDHWIFRFEDEVEVLEPEGLRRGLMEKLGRMVGRHGA